MDDFRGPLPAEALADIYAGRHEKVPAAVLKEASHFMRYSYAVYSLDPKIERPPSLLDVACWKPPSPEDVSGGRGGGGERQPDKGWCEQAALCSSCLLGT